MDSGPGAFRRDAFYHVVNGIAVTAQMKPGRRSQSRDQSPVRAQSRCDEQRFTGEVFPAGQAAALQLACSLNDIDGLGADEPDGILSKTPTIS